MEFKNPEALVTGEWLEANLDDPNLRIIDATYHLPHADRDAYEEWTFRHIPGSVHFDIDKIADTSSGLPHMLPDAATFADTLGQMGISNDHKIVVYDANGGYMAACRVWWMLRTFGYDNAAVLDGGLVRWGRERRALETEEPIIRPAEFKAEFNPALVKSKAEMLANLGSEEFQVLDARNEGRFSGVDHEPRPTESRGHIPGSKNVPFTFITPPSHDFTFQNADEIFEILDAEGIDLDKPAVATCGSGVTACVVAFALYLLGHEDVAVYDGSWAEWGDSPDVPIGA
ncbi:3-mercaptopyruvate sulfurtransferase [Pseudomonadota bacterium]